MLLRASFKGLVKKYFKIFEINWQNIFVYRFNFVVWRTSIVFKYLSIYFFWFAVYQYQGRVGFYSRNTMLTYIFLAGVLRNFVTVSRSSDVAVSIATGELSRHLIQPVDYFKKLFIKDCSDKAANLFFMIFEVSAIYLLLQPPILIPEQKLNLILFFASIILAVVLYFYLNLLISLFTFWYPEHHGWPLRYLFQVTNVFLAGQIIPLDLLPDSLQFIEYLPSAYLIYFPVQIYLKKLEVFFIIKSMVLGMLWVFILQKTVRYLWNKGIKNYTAAGL
jgi:ABC-2 type transport system permease protein